MLGLSRFHYYQKKHINSKAAEQLQLLQICDGDCGARFQRCHDGIHTNGYRRHEDQDVLWANDLPVVDIAAHVSDEVVIPNEPCLIDIYGYVMFNFRSQMFLPWIEDLIPMKEVYHKNFKKANIVLYVVKYVSFPWQHHLLFSIQTTFNIACL